MVEESLEPAKGKVFLTKVSHLDLAHTNHFLSFFIDGLPIFYHANKLINFIFQLVIKF